MLRFWVQDFLARFSVDGASGVQGLGFLGFRVFEHGGRGGWWLGLSKLGGCRLQGSECRPLRVVAKACCP